MRSIFDKDCIKVRKERRLEIEMVKKVKNKRLVYIIEIMS